MRILIAEDDLTSRLVLEAALRGWGYDVVSASRGDQAWTLLQAEDRPGLAILDRLMPGMDGIQVCRKLRERDTQNPVYVILLTALGRKDLIWWAIMDSNHRPLACQARTLLILKHWH